MKKIFLLFALCIIPFATPAFAAGTGAVITSCGDGYKLVNTKKTDGVQMAECQKIWCRDLENGKYMGSGDTANSGYRTTPAPTELCDADHNCTECFGDRKWCSGQQQGRWNPEYGAYTRAGAESNAYLSTQSGDCFKWDMQKPSCDDGKVAILKGGTWVCASSSGAGAAGSIRQSAIHRTGAIKIKK